MKIIYFKFNLYLLFSIFLIRIDSIWLLLELRALNTIKDLDKAEFNIK